MIKIHALATALLAGASPAIAAPLAIDAPFGAHAVVQRDRAIALSGDAAPASTVT